MWELDHKEGWTPKNSCLQIVLEKIPESPLDSKEIKPVNPKDNQSWIFIGRTDAEAPILWPPDGKSWHIGKDLDAEKYSGQEEMGATQDVTVGWHHWVNGHRFEETPGDSEGKGSLAWWVHGVAENWTWLSSWTTATCLLQYIASVVGILISFPITVMFNMVANNHTQCEIRLVWNKMYYTCVKCTSNLEESVFKRM